MATQLVDLVSLMARALVDQPDKVHVQEVDGGRSPSIELEVAPEDIGKVIGKEGRTAQSMRVILSAAANKMGKRAHLEILD